jgi:Tfp pilus assembly protein PilE
VKPQRGLALLEALAVVAIVALCAGALLAAVSAVAKLDGSPGRNRAAAALLAAQILRVAEDAWKYGTPGEAPAGSTTAFLPLEGSSSTVPVTISTALSSRTADGAAITVTVSYPSGEEGAGSAAVSMSAPLRVKAPLPGTQVERPGLIPQPAGAH